MESAFVIQKPRSRGKFSRERHIWDQIHRDRFERWLEGDTIDSIAQVHGVTCRAVHLSIARQMAHLHRDDRRQALQYRHNSKYGWKIQDAALIQYQALMNPSALFAEIDGAMRQAARASRSRKR
jgi:hypothetical protein